MENLLFLLFKLTLVSLCFGTDTTNNYLNKHFQAEEAGEFGISYRVNVSNEVQLSWTFTYNYSVELEPFIETSVSSLASLQTPIVVEVRHVRSDSWTLPFRLDGTNLYNSLNKSLCTVTENGFESQRVIQVVLSTQSYINIEAFLRVSLRNVILSSDGITATWLSETSPTYFKLTALSSLGTKFTRIDITSLDTEKSCFTVSVQLAKCPLQDSIIPTSPGIIRHTMSKSTSISINSDLLNDDRFLVLVNHGNYSRCDSEQGGYWKDVIYRSGGLTDITPDYVEIKVLEGISNSEFYAAVLTMLAVFIVVAAAFPLMHAYLLKDWILEATSSYNPNANLDDDVSKSSKMGDEPEFQRFFIFFFVRNDQLKHNWCIRSCCNIEAEATKYSINRNPDRYSSVLWIVSMFYAVPAIQYVFLYQRNLNRSGDEDICYYNFKCHHTAWIFNAFNHVYSNVGYMILGITFMATIFFHKVGGDETEDWIFKHNGLFYALGGALFMEGVMSATYHVCPTQLNFQFDTCFMYITAMLCTAKLFRSRHPHHNPSAIMAFLGTGCVILLAAATAFFQQIWLWILISLVHLLSVFMMCLHIYSSGHWRFFTSMPQEYGLSFRDKLKSMYEPVNWKDSLSVMLSVIFVLNIVLVALIYALFYDSKDIATSILGIFLFNMFSYVVLYIVKKIKSKEGLHLGSLVYLTLSLPCWLGGMYFFTRNTMTWTLSQAESREMNKECVFMNFYDYHDLWHFLSAFGMFSMFMFLFTMDGNLRNKDRSAIKIF